MSSFLIPGKKRSQSRQDPDSMESADSDPVHMTERKRAPSPASREVWVSEEREGTVDGVRPVGVKER